MEKEKGTILSYTATAATELNKQTEKVLKPPNITSPLPTHQVNKNKTLNHVHQFENKIRLHNLFPIHKYRAKEQKIGYKMQ